jgi:hypothetical protein
VLLIAESDVILQRKLTLMRRCANIAMHTFTACLWSRNDKRPLGAMRLPPMLSQSDVIAMTSFDIRLREH